MFQNFGEYFDSWKDAHIIVKAAIIRKHGILQAESYLMKNQKKRII